MKPFLQGKKNLALESLRAPSGLSVHGSACSPGESGGRGPTVEAVKEGDKVVRLVITCVCGERIEVECLYPAGS